MEVVRDDCICPRVIVPRLGNGSLLRFGGYLRVVLTDGTASHLLDDQMEDAERHKRQERTCHY